MFKALLLRLLCAPNNGSAAKLKAKTLDLHINNEPKLKLKTDAQKRVKSELDAYSWESENNRVWTRK